MRELLERLFQVDFLKGLAVTFRAQNPKNIVTEQYPLERPMVAERYRGAPRLNNNPETGETLCIGCNLCALACPENLIVVGWERDDATRRKVLTFFTYDTSRCMFCGLCEDACPTSRSLNPAPRGSPPPARRNRKNSPSSPSAVPGARDRLPAWNTAPSRTACFGCRTKTVHRLGASRLTRFCASAARNASARAPTAASSMAVRGMPSSWSISRKSKKKSDRCRTELPPSLRISAGAP